MKTYKPQYRLDSYEKNKRCYCWVGRNFKRNLHWIKRVAFMKQVEKDQRSSNEFSMRLEITASFFSAAPLFSVLCNRCAAQNPYFRLFAVLSPSLHPGVSFSLFLNSSVSLCNVLRGFFHFNHCYFAYFLNRKPSVSFLFTRTQVLINWKTLYAILYGVQLVFFPSHREKTWIHNILKLTVHRIEMVEWMKASV